MLSPSRLAPVSFRRLSRTISSSSCLRTVRRASAMAPTDPPAASATTAAQTTTTTRSADATPNPNRPAASASAADLPSDRRPLVISGPSGVGKGTLIKRLFAAHPGSFALSVSHTTRAPRPGERHGVDYYYVEGGPEAFAELAQRDGGRFFLESARFGSNCYGTSRQTVAEQSAGGRVVVLDIEMEGVKQIQASGGLNARYVFVKPPSFAALEARLRGRGTEDEAAVARRLDQARRELAWADSSSSEKSSGESDGSGSGGDNNNDKRKRPHDAVLVNDDLDAAFAELEAYVYEGRLPTSSASSASASDAQ
ncbi:P-loop containing nucleoside triphosphate hydrolase protein [Xylariaceae sp. FL0804]|nr:P-loop containing nucleoside triphosphate hydrolase protein [Xylariaceae sp. FL0804]